MAYRNERIKSLQSTMAQKKFLVSTVESETLRPSRITIAQRAYDAVLSRLDHAGEARRKSLKICRLCDRNDVSQAELLLLRLARYSKPSDDALTAYVLSGVVKGKHSLAELLASEKLIDSFQRDFLLSALHFSRGEYGDALKKLAGASRAPNYLKPEMMRLRHLAAKQAGFLKRSIKFGFQYLAVKNKPDIGVSSGMIVLAERTGDQRLLSASLAAAFQDARDIERQAEHFQKDWERVVHFRLTTFDLDSAEKIARRAFKMQLRGAKRVRSLIRVIREESGGISEYLDEARAQLRRLAKGKRPIQSAGSVTVVVASAVLNYRSHDPDNFRSSLRMIYTQISKALSQHGLDPVIVAKVDSRSERGLQQSARFISYHTTSSDPSGLHFKEAYYPGTFTFDRTGYSGWSELADQPLVDLMLNERCPISEVEKYYVYLQERIKANSSKYKQGEFSETVKTPTKFVFVGLQVISDSVQRLARVPMLDMLDEVASTNASRGIETVVKRHPLCRSSLVNETLLTGQRNGRWVISNASVHQLIAKSSAVCVVNSGVGIEALAHLKPVYLFGKADYRHVCFDIMEAGEYTRVFRENALPVSPTTIKQYLYFFRNIHLIDLNQPDVGVPALQNRLNDYLMEVKSQIENSSERRAL